MQRSRNGERRDKEQRTEFQPAPVPSSTPLALQESCTAWPRMVNWVDFPPGLWLGGEEGRKQFSCISSLSDLSHFNLCSLWGFSYLYIFCCCSSSAVGCVFSWVMDDIARKWEIFLVWPNKHFQGHMWWRKTVLSRWGRKGDKNTSFNRSSSFLINLPLHSHQKPRTASFFPIFFPFWWLVLSNHPQEPKKSQSESSP